MAKDSKPEARVVTPPPASAPEAGYETFDGEEAQRYNRRGGHLISITPRYPSKTPGVPAFRPGKRYRFLESKTTLEQLRAAAGEE